jgi:hypothetical protein
MTDEMKKCCKTCAFMCEEVLCYCYLNPPVIRMVPKEHECYNQRHCGIQSERPVVAVHDFCSHWTPQSWHDEVSE